MLASLTQPTIRIGTLVSANQAHPADILRQILPYGFESFSLTFWQTTGGADLRRLAEQVREVLCESNATISSLAIFGNPLETAPLDLESLAAWEQLIDNAHLFGADIVAGFTGRLRGRPIPDSLPRFKEVFTPLAQRAADHGVRIAFENCDMGGTWRSGDWNIAHNPVAWEMMFDAVPAANLGLEWEPCHQMVNLIDPMPRAAAVGVKDLPRPWQGRYDPLGRHPPVRHRRRQAVRLPPHARLWRQQLDRHHQRAALGGLPGGDRHRGLPRPGLSRRAGNDRPGGRAELSQTLPRR